MPVVVEAFARQTKAMPTKTLLPLSQQILAWIIDALGYRNAGVTRLGVSAGTLKNARQGRPVPQSWGDLVDGFFRVFEPPEAVNIDELVESLRSWDARVSGLSLVGDLPLEKRLVTVFLLAIPEVASRLGSLAACCAASTSSDIGSCMWLVRPFDRGFFGAALEWILRQSRPEWKTWEDRLDGLEDAVNKRTVERWRSGAIDVPSPKAIEKIVERLGPKAELVLRFARAVSVLRRDLLGGGDHMPWLGEAKVSLVSGLPALGQITNEEAAERFGMLADSLCDSSVTSEARTIATWVMFVAPPPEILRGIARVAGAPGMFELSVVDKLQFIEGVWNLIILLRVLRDDGKEITVLRDGEFVPVLDLAPNLRELGIELLDGLSSFFASDGGDDLFLRFVAELQRVFGGDVGDDGHVLVPPGLMRAVADRYRELLPDDVVQKLPLAEIMKSRSLQIRRARLAAQAGDTAGAFAILPKAERAPSERERKELAELFCAVAHNNLDDVRIVVAEVDSQGEREEALLERVLRLVDTIEKVAAIILQQFMTEDPRDERLSLRLRLSIELRTALLRERLCGVLPSTTLVQLHERLEVVAAEAETDGRLWATLAVSGEVLDAGSTKIWRKLAVHHGSEAYLDEVEARLAGDRRSFEDLLAERERAADSDRAACPDCEGTGWRPDPPEAIADEAMACTCMLIPSHWRDDSPR